MSVGERREERMCVECEGTTGTAGSRCLCVLMLGGRLCTQQRRHMISAKKAVDKKEMTTQSYCGLSLATTPVDEDMASPSAEATRNTEHFWN